MKQLHGQQYADELHTLTEAEVEKVSGGADALLVDLGPLGSFEFWQRCVIYNLSSNGGKSTFTSVQCGGGC